MEELQKIIMSKYSNNSFKGFRELMMQSISIFDKKSTLEHREKAINLAVFVSESLGLRETSMITAVVYELYYSQLITKEIIKSHYPETVIKLIDRIEKIEELYHMQKPDSADIFHKLILSLAEDVRVILIILARRLYALRNIILFEKEEQHNLIDEITFVYLPFAHRLGLYNIKMEMEDRILHYNEPKVYDNLVQQLEDSKAERLEFISKFIHPIKEKLNKEKIAYEIKYRTKSIASILSKIRKKNISLKDIYDIFAIRVIIDTLPENEKKECWQTYSIVSDIYRPNPKRLRDWITIPKSTGYESLHTTVMTKENRWVEVQIRTKRMDEIAEKGFASHWRYKAGDGNRTLDEWLLTVREMLENSGKDGGSEVMDDMLLEISDKEVYVFTPNGDLKQLPQGSTILDFAYSIHGDLGNTCTGGKINNQNVPIRYRLQSGDEVKIYSSKTQKPSRDWLHFVVTSKAKSQIRNALKQEQLEEASFGKETLMRRMKNWGVVFNDLTIRDLMRHYKIKQVHELYYGVAVNKLDLNDIKEVLTTRSSENTDAQEVIPEKSQQNKPSGFLGDKDVLVISDKVSGVDFTLSSCCSPVFGDSIFGFVSILKGIKIHRKNCPNADNMISRYPYRVVPACWTRQGDSLYLISLKIIGEDTHGMVNRITELIANTANINLRNIRFSSNGGEFTGNIILEIPNKGYLDMISAKIQTLKGVHKVIRSK